MAPCNGTTSTPPKVGRHPPQQSHPAMAPSNGTTSTAPCRGATSNPPKWFVALPPLLEVRTLIAIAIWGTKQNGLTRIHGPSKIAPLFLEAQPLCHPGPCTIAHPVGAQFLARIALQKMPDHEGHRVCPGGPKLSPESLTERKQGPCRTSQKHQNLKLKRHPTLHGNVGINRQSVYR